MIHLFRIGPRLKPKTVKTVKNVVPSFGRQASAKPTLARVNLPLVRMMRLTISALGISTRLLLPASLDLAAQERLRVSGAHSPRARWAGRRSSPLYAKPLIFSRMLARRRQVPQGVPFFDLGGYQALSTAVILFFWCSRSSSAASCAFGSRTPLIFILFFHLLAPISHVPPFLSMTSVRLNFLYPRFLSFASVVYRLPRSLYTTMLDKACGGFVFL